VLRVDFGCDGKISKAIQTAYGKNDISKTVAVLMISASTEENKFMVAAFTNKNNKDIDCKAWATAAVAGTGAKGGGKKDSAQFQVMDLKHIDAVTANASQA